MNINPDRKKEYFIVGILGLILVITGIVFLFFNWIISLILFCTAFGIHTIYYYFFLIRAKKKVWTLTPGAPQPCLIFGALIVAAIVIVSTVSVIF